MLWQLPNKSTCDECWAERGPLCLLKSAGSDQRLLSASAFEVGPASPALRPARQFMTHFGRRVCVAVIKAMPICAEVRRCF